MGGEALVLVKIIWPIQGNARARKQEWVGWGAGGGGRGRGFSSERQLGKGIAFEM